MAKNDNLTDFLADVANAIREKKGTTDLINPQDFSAEIASIETGGGGESGGGGGAAATAGAVNFRDYDGTILHSFGKDEFLAMTELPELPTQAGLICQGWNWTMSEALDYVQKYGNLEIGATYITEDGKTRLYVSIPSNGVTLPLYWYQSKENGVLIDWGDGSPTTSMSAKSYINTTHTYANKGDYIITMQVLDGTALLGKGNQYYCVLGDVSSGYADRVFANMLTKVEIGEKMNLGTYGLQYCRGLSTITISESVNSTSRTFQYTSNLRYVVLPRTCKTLNGNDFFYCYGLRNVSLPPSVTTISAKAFAYCYSLQSINLPPLITAINDNTFSDCFSLSSVTIPQGCTMINSYAFNYCRSLSSVIIPNGVTTIGAYAFQYCSSLSSVEMPESVTSLLTYAFYMCESLNSIRLSSGISTINEYTFAYNSVKKFVIPSSVTRISANAFAYDRFTACFDFRASTAVPTLENTSGFAGIVANTKIVVPDSLFDSWVAASNWSTYASKIVKASAYNG